MNAHAFLQQVEINPTLQSVLAEVGGDIPMILGLARELGFPLTAGELLQARERVRRRDAARAVTTRRVGDPIPGPANPRG